EDMVGLKLAAPDAGWRERPDMNPQFIKAFRASIVARARFIEALVGEQAGAQAWKRQRLVELGFGVPDWLRLVPVDFEAGDSWLQKLAAAGFDAAKPAVVVSPGGGHSPPRGCGVATL